MSAALQENADKCSWTWGDRYPATNGFGGIANVNMKGRDYQVGCYWPAYQNACTPPPGCR